MKYSKKIAARDTKLIRSAFGAIDSKNNSYRTAWLEYERLYNSKHTEDFLQEAADLNRSDLFIPTAYTTIEIAMSVFSAAFFSNGFPIEITGVGDSDKDSAAALTSVAKYYYKKDRPQARLEKAFLEAGLYGLGAVKTYWDSDKNIPATRHTHITDIAFDSEAEDIEDIGYMCTKFKQTNKIIAQKIKSKFYTPDKSVRDILGSDYQSNLYKRHLIYEIFHKQSDGSWLCRTYLKDITLREVKFRQLPTKYGHLLHKLPSIEQSDRENEVAVYGDSMIRVIKELVKEINTSRNQKSDIIAKKIADEHFIPTTSGINVNDMNKIGHKRCTTTDGIQRVGTADTYDLTQDDMIYKRDLEEASSINGIMRASTSTSDRRSGTSLAMISANASLRLEGMIRLLHDTLFLKWAEDWIKLVYVNAPDDVVQKVTELDGFPLGKYGDREFNTDIDFTINFGMSINKQNAVESIMQALQMLQPLGADIVPLLKEMVRLLLGENTNVERIFQNVGVQGDGGVSDASRGGAQEDASSPRSVQGADDGLAEDTGVQGSDEREALARLINNKI